MVHDDVYLAGHLLRSRGLRSFTVNAPRRVELVLEQQHDNGQGEEKYTVGSTPNVRVLQKDCIAFFGNFTS